MLLHRLHANVSLRDCKDCWLYVYDEKTGERALHGGRPHRRGGGFPPCKICKKKSPDAFQTLLPHNMEAYAHYLECKAIGQFPDDPIVRRNAGIIRAAEEIADKTERQNEKMSEMISRLRMQWPK